VSDLVKSPDVLTEEFRARGLKVTPQRQRIFRALFEGVDHPTAEAVYAAVADDLPTISLRTVYQTLNDLAAMGEVHQLDLGTGSTRFDTNLDAHHHFVCEVCDRVVDVLPDFTDVQFPVALSDEFCVSSTEIVFRGRCRSCGSELDAPSGT
jgi:Fe2+ or Zn2+ uptake regulation protein